MRHCNDTSRFKLIFLAGVCLWLATFASCLCSKFEEQILSLRMGGPARLRFVGVDGFIYCQFKSTNAEPGGASMSDFADWCFLQIDWLGPSWNPEWRLYWYSDRTFTGWEIAFPHWLLLLTLTAVVIWAWVRLLQSRKRASMLDLCRVCGYDLRASPQRCPECGTPRTPATPAPQAMP